jgi:hypothetical protein
LVGTANLRCHSEIKEGSYAEGSYAEGFVLDGDLNPILTKATKSRCKVGDLNPRLSPVAQTVQAFWGRNKFLQHSCPLPEAFLVKYESNSLPT